MQGDIGTLVLPGEPVPVRLMNTIWADRSGLHDALTTTGDLRAWLAATHPGPGQPEPGPGDLDRYRALRDALRRLAALVTGDTRAAAASATVGVGVARAVAEVNRAAAQAPIWSKLVYHDGDLQAVAGGGATPARRALSSIARQAVGLLTGQDGITLRACRAPGCVLYFTRDHPRRQWCSVACGNRVRAARHYQRHRHGEGADHGDSDSG